MAIFTQTVTAQQILDALTTDSTKWAGANIANLTKDVSTLFYLQKTDKQYFIYDDFDDTDLYDRAIYPVIYDTIRNGKYPYRAIAGSPSISSGKLIIPADAEVKSQIPEPTQYGVWELSYRNQSTLTTNVIYLNVFEIDSNNRFRISIGTSSTTVDFTHSGTDDTLITGSASTDTNNHIFKLKRDRNGNWEFWKDGSSQGTATNTNTISGDGFIHFESFPSVPTCEIDYIRGW